LTVPIGLMAGRDRVVWYGVVFRKAGLVTSASGHHVRRSARGG
jgi:hypothetical protein